MILILVSGCVIVSLVFSPPNNTLLILFCLKQPELVPGMPSYVSLLHFSYLENQLKAPTKWMISENMRQSPGYH